MGKPRLIIIVRHGQSEGNKNRDIHQTIPDHRVKLTPQGWHQAYDAGRRLRALLRPDDTLHFFTSPYRRTRETTEGILATLTSDDPEPSPFQRSNIKVYEEPRLREQDFGNFQPCSAEMERMWQERADYGHFFYRIPNGESAADAYDRISGFNESLWRQFGEDDFASVCVLVTHGLMSRIFLMKWYHFSVEYFEDLRNINHCEFLIMRRNDETGKYILENKLRTWSELKRNTLQEEDKDNGNSKDASKLARAGSYEVRRRWGGCPNGCNHDKNFKIRKSLADLVKTDSIVSSRADGAVVTESSSTSTSASTTTVVNGTSTNSSAAVGPPHSLSNPSFNGTANSQSLANRRPAARRFQSRATSDEDNNDGDPSAPLGPVGPQIDVTKARDEVVSSPDGTPSFISVEDRLRSRLKSPNLPPRPFDSGQLHVGRDFGGSYSGHNSAASDTDDDDASQSDQGAAVTASVTPTPASAAAAAATAAAAAASASANGMGSRPLTTHGDPPNHLLPGAPAPHHRHHHREKSGMGRGTRANRLGDHHSSDGEHEADGEQSCGGDDGGSSSSSSSSSEADEEESSDELRLAKGSSDGETKEMVDEADEALRRVEIEEKEDRSIMGSVF